MDQKHYYTGLILKFLSGKIQPNEKVELDAWRAADEDHRTFFEAMQSNWENYPASQQETTLAYQQLARRLSLPQDPVTFSQTETTYAFRNIPLVWLRTAAAFIGFLLLAFLTYHLISPSMTVYQTGYGETASYRLPDSSVITLNANSSLEFTDNWQKKGVREIWLDGEAFFKITKTSKNSTSGLPIRFVVHTPQVDVEVLGTSFNVEDRRGTTTVVLNSGKVKLKSDRLPDSEVVMQPGDYVAMSESQDQLIRKVVNPAHFSSWTKHKLIMNHTSLGEIAQTIQDYYGLQVRFNTVAIAEKTLTGSIPTDDLNRFLDVLSASADVQIERRGNALVFQNQEEP